MWISCIPLNEPKWNTDTLLALQKQFATWTSLRIEWLYRQARRTEERVSRQGCRGGCWGVEEFIEQIGEAVTLWDVWDVIASRRRRTVTADLVVKPVSNQIRSVEGFSAGLNRCCVLGKRQKLQSRLNFIYPWQAQKWRGIKTEIKSNHDRVEALSSEQGRRKLEENWIIFSEIAKLCENIWRYYNAMPTKPDNEVDISLIVGRSTSVIFILL